MLCRLLEISEKWLNYIFNKNTWLSILKYLVSRETLGIILAYFAFVVSIESLNDNISQQKLDNLNQAVQEYATQLQQKEYLFTIYITRQRDKQDVLNEIVVNNRVEVLRSVINANINKKNKYSKEIIDMVELGHLVYELKQAELQLSDSKQKGVTDTQFQEDRIAKLESQIGDRTFESKDYYLNLEKYYSEEFHTIENTKWFIVF